MLKLINHIIKVDKTRRGASLQVIQLAQNFQMGIAFGKIACILYNSELLIKVMQSKKKWRYQCLYWSRNFILYSQFLVLGSISHNNKIGKFNNQCKS